MRNIIQYPNDILSQKAKSITEINSTINSIIEDMKFYLLKDTSVGLAAPQLGESIRFIGVKYGIDILFLINPEIIKFSDKTYPSLEGCLSIDRGQSQFMVKRYKIVKVRALNLQSQLVTYKARDLFGRVLQHEIDHLNGILINNQIAPSKASS